MAKKTWTTPKGRAVYPRINGKPDTRFNEDGEWRLRLLLSAEDAADLIQKLDAEHTESLASAKKEEPKKKWKKGTPPYKVQEDGNVEFSFVMNAQRTDKKTNSIVSMRPALFGADGKPLPDKYPLIGGGSVVRVSFTPAHTTFQSSAHVKLYLNAVQIIELVEYQSDGSRYGFENEAGEDDDANEVVEDGSDAAEESDGEASDGDF